GFFENVFVQGRHVLGRAEPRLGFRLHQRVMDIKGRPHLLLCRASYHVHGQKGLCTSNTAKSGAGDVDDWLHRTFLVGLRATVDFEMAEAGGQGTMAGQTELLRGHDAFEIRRYPKRGARILETTDTDVIMRNPLLVSRGGCAIKKKLRSHLSPRRRSGRSQLMFSVIDHFS